MKIWIKLCSIDKWMLVELPWNRWKIFHYINACVDQAFRIMAACCVLHHYYQLMLLGPHIDPLCGARGQVLLLMKIKHLCNVKKQCVLHFSQIGWVRISTPFDVLHEHFENIGACYIWVFNTLLWNLDRKSIRRAFTSCSLQNEKIKSNKII
jgi:hypothetical protein